MPEILTRMLGSALTWSITQVRWAVVNWAKGEASLACLLSPLGLGLGADTTRATIQAKIRIVDLIVLLGIRETKS